MSKPKLTNFLNRLFILLEQSKKNDIIEWNQEQNGFIVYDSQRLSKEVLPQFFKHDKLTSFIRQLNMYSFQKVYKNNCQFSYSHRFFTKNQINNFKKIKRKRESNKVCCTDQQENSYDQYEQYASIQKRQNKLERACNISIKRTGRYLVRAQENWLALLQDQKKSRQEFLEIAFTYLKEDGLSKYFSNIEDINNCLNDSPVFDRDFNVQADQLYAQNRINVSDQESENIQGKQNQINASSDIMEILVQMQHSNLDYRQFRFYN